MFRVRSKQSVQERRAAAGQPHDKKRVADFLSHDAGIKLPVPLHEQTRTQCAYEIAPECDLSDQVKSGLTVAGLEQPRERINKIAFSKIIETTATLRRIDQINCKRWDACNSGFLQQRAAAIEKSRGQDKASLLEGSDRGIHSVNKDYLTFCQIWRRLATTTLVQYQCGAQQLSTNQTRT